jgi:hypothetical protein
MRLIGEKPRGGTLDTNEQAEALDEFNTFLESLSIENLVCYTKTQDSHLLTASTASYTIGIGATINTTRPTKLVDPCWVRDSNGYDYTLKVINLETYGVISAKSADATIPVAIYYDAGLSSTSSATLTLYPPPSASLTLFIHSLKQFNSAISMSTNYLLPVGYREFIESNFAIRLAAGFRPVSAELAKVARETKAAVKALNSPALISRLDSGSVMSMSVDRGINIDSD